MEPVCNILFTGKGPIDVTSLRQQIEGNPCAFRHPHSADEAYIISPHPSTARLVQANLAKNPHAGIGGCAFLRIYPESLWLLLDMAADSALHQVALLLLPLLRQHEFKVLTETGLDVTASYREKLEELFR